MFPGVCAMFAVAVCAVASEGRTLERLKRQDDSEEGGHVIDSIFNIPITAIRQTASAAQSFSPGNSQTIDSLLNIPVSTLEAVGNLVKATSGQRRQNAEELQRIRRERRDKLMAQRERQRLQKERLQDQRLKQQQIKRTIKLNHKDPFGLNALSLLVSNHGLFGGIQGVFGNHGGHGGLGGHGGSPGGLGDHGGHGQGSTNNQNTYEVHENVEEDTNYMWHGITAGIGTIYGSRPTSTQIAIQNKIPPKDRRPIDHAYDSSRIRNKIAPSMNELGYEEDPPLENKIAPKSNRITFQ